MKGKIYQIVNDINDKVYIGKTVDSLENRFNQHIRDSKKRSREHRPLYNAINKYGQEHFTIQLVEECELSELSTREIYWIGYFNSYEKGYNATLGGDGKILYDYDLIVQLYNTGKTGKEIMSIIGCDQKVVTNALKSANINSYTNMIKHHSKGVRAYDLNHNFIQEFNSELDAARWLIATGKTKTDNEKHVGTVLGRVAKGKRKTAYKMYWEFID